MTEICIMAQERVKELLFKWQIYNTGDIQQWYERTNKYPQNLWLKINTCRAGLKFNNAG